VVDPPACAACYPAVGDGLTIIRRPAATGENYGTSLGGISAYDSRSHADCVGLKKYGGLRYLSRES
jgi:hypothetical protein